MGYQLGIDVGTTYTAAAVCRSSDHRWVEPETVTLGTRSATVPSVIFVAPDGSVVVGEAAERRALTDPDRVVREFKRRIGDPTPIIVGGRAWAPEELSARLVRWVVDRVAEREGGPASRIALTHPASWGGHKKELLVAALAGQGLTVSFLAEPQAAALHYATEERVPPGSTIAVYDLGGGTFDAAVVRKADPGDAAYGAAGFGLLGRPEGLDHLGGVDFDEVVFDHVRDGLPDAFADLEEGDPAVLSAVARVRRECTEAKEALSADTEVSIPVLLPAARGSVRLHRSEFEGLIREQVEETVEALRRAVLSAGCAPEALTAVLLVGGSSRIPMVAQLVSDGLGRPVAVDTDPKNAIAKGAALAVSPKPTASWPEVAIPPVPAAAAGSAAAAASANASASTVVSDRPGASAAVAPPRSGAPVGVGAGMAAAAGAQSRALAGGEAGRADRGRPMLSREPGRGLVSSLVAAPPQRPGVHSGPSFEEGEREAVAPPRRPVALLVGIGGLLAVAAIVLAALLIPKLTTTSSPGIVTDSGTGSAATATTAPAAGPGPVAPGPAPSGAVVNPGPTEHGGAVPGPRSSGGGGTGNAPNSNPPAPLPAPPAAPAPTTVPVPSSAPAPTSAAPTPTGSPTTVAQGSSSTAPAPGGATPVNTGSSGGTGSTDGVTPVGTGSSGGATPVSTGTGGGATPAGTGSGGTGSGGTGSGGKVTPVSTGTGSDAGRATAEAAAPAPTVSA